jgi:uncharacterized membrane protein HdeD (DUF308 family)
MERGFFYGLLWSLSVGAFVMLQFTAELWVNLRPSAVLVHLSAYLAIAAICFGAFREARRAQRNKNGWWAMFGAVLGILIGQQAILCLAFLVYIAGRF